MHAESAGMVELAICNKEQEGEKSTTTTTMTKKKLAPAAVMETIAVGSVKIGCTVGACERTTLAAENLFGSRSRGLQCSVKRAMLFAQFSEDEANNKKALQRRVQRCMERIVKGPQIILNVLCPLRRNQNYQL